MFLHSDWSRVARLGHRNGAGPRGSRELKAVQHKRYRYHRCLSLARAGGFLWAAMVPALSCLCVKPLFGPFQPADAVSHEQRKCEECVKTCRTEPLWRLLSPLTDVSSLNHLFFTKKKGKLNGGVYYWSLKQQTWFKAVSLTIKTVNKSVWRSALQRETERVWYKTGVIKWVVINSQHRLLLCSLSWPPAQHQCFMQQFSHPPPLWFQSKLLLKT